MESRLGIFYRLFLFLLGFLTLSVQVILIREFMALFQGNELIIGLFLGAWMIFTAAGAYLSTITFQRKAAQSINFPATILVLLSVLPSVMLFAMPYLKGLMIPAGAMASPDQIILIIIFIIGPFCILSGILFPILSNKLSSHKDANLLHEAYGLDSAGGIFGAILFSLVLIFILKPFESLALISIMCFIVSTLWSMVNHRKIQAAALALIGIAMGLVCFLTDPDQRYNDHVFSDQDVIQVKASPFGKLAVTKTDDQINFYENGIPLVSSDNAVIREEAVHYAMLSHAKPQFVLMISGGSAGSIKEALKYPEASIDYIEFNPWLFNLIEPYGPFPENSRISYFFQDPRLFLLHPGKNYDVILLNTPAPLSAEMNRFYTLEFFRMAKKRLNPGGIISCSVPAAGNYMNASSRMVHSVYYNTMQAVFQNIRIIPGEKDYYLASDSIFEHALFHAYDSIGLANIYVNPFYISEDLQNLRSAQIMKDLSADAPVNSDLKPYIFSALLKHQLTRFNINYIIIPAILAFATVLAFIFLGPVNLGLFTGGFTSTSLEFLLLIWFQVLFGFVYQMTGVIFAVFMAGMALGSFYHFKIIKQATFSVYLRLQGLMAILSTLIATLFLLFSSSPFPLFSSLYTKNSLILLIMALVFISGSLMGVQFSLSTHLRKTNFIKSSGESFSADLAGSAVGIALTSIYLVPVLGLVTTGILLGALNLAAILVMVIHNRLFYKSTLK